MMIFRCIRPFVALSVILGLMAGMSACRRPGADSSKKAAGPVVDTKLRYNRLSDVPSALHKAQAGSPIHWQPWTKETMELARKSHRLMFVVVALPQSGSFQQVLGHLEANPGVVANLNDEYVPVLLDADAAREIGLLMPVLCGEINYPLYLPVFLWLTFEGNAVGWIPVSSHGSKEVVAMFDQSHGMMMRMWKEDSGYVLRNSALDNQNRRARMEAGGSSIVYSAQPEADVVRALRKMTSLYDPYTRSFDEAGGLFPYGTLELLSVAARQPGLPEELREKCGGVVRDLLDDLLPSAMFDPLEGGVFSTRRGSSWVLPTFQQDCSGQARVINALVEAFHTTADPLAMDRALDVLRFAESRYRTEDGLYAIGLSSAVEAEDWMWRLEDFKKLLPAEQAEWWIREAGIKGLGNLPPGLYFRANTIALAKPIRQYAEESPLGAEAFLAAFESSRKKLLDARKARMASRFQDRIPHAGATFRMVSAYAAMFTATKDAGHRDKAVALLKAARTAFSDGRYLRSMKGDRNDELSLGRAFHYALALEAALDVANITGDPVWMAWAEDLATLAAEQFGGNGVFKECPDPARTLDLPISDSVMLFDDSSAGLYSLSASRLESNERPGLREFWDIVGRLPDSAVSRPVQHADLLLASLLAHYPVRLSYKGSLPESIAEVAQSLPLRGVLRGQAKPEQVEEAAVIVIWPGGQERVVRTGEELRAVMAEMGR